MYVKGTVYEIQYCIIGVPRKANKKTGKNIIKEIIQEHFLELKNMSFPVKRITMYLVHMMEQDIVFGNIQNMRDLNK
jgi:hypothetical protein